MVQVLLSGVLSAIVAGIVAAWIAQRKISIENITQDRRAWREKIRKKSLSVHNSLISRDEGTLNRLRAEFRSNLNPNDENDMAIISCISLPDEGKELEHAEEFSKHIAHLLKHDWERAKLEAGPFVMRVKHVRDWIGAILYRPEHTKCDQKQNGAKENEMKILTILFQLIGFALICIGIITLGTANHDPDSFLLKTIHQQQYVQLLNVSVLVRSLIWIILGVGMSLLPVTFKNYRKVDIPAQ